MRLCKECCDSTIKNCYLCSIGQEIIMRIPSNDKHKSKSAKGGEREELITQNHRHNKNSY